MCKEIVSRLFSQKPEVKPVQPTAPQIPVPEWRRREQERLNQGVIEQRIWEQYGINTPTSGTDKTPPPTAKAPRKTGY